MPKFDWGKVSGYREDMTAEEKLALLMEDDAIPEPSPTVSKDVFDKTASELAKVKRELREKQTAEETAEAERAAREAAMDEELKTLRREKTISTHKASFLALGYDEKLASTAAEALADGKTEAVFAAMGQNLDAVKKAADTAALDNTKKPPAGDPPTADNADLRGYMGL
jgi:hypothetical protein